MRQRDWWLGKPDVKKRDADREPDEIDELMARMDKELAIMAQPAWQQTKFWTLFLATFDPEHLEDFRNAGGHPNSEQFAFIVAVYNGRVRKIRGQFKGVRDYKYMWEVDDKRIAEHRKDGGEIPTAYAILKKRAADDTEYKKLNDRYQRGKVVWQTIQERADIHLKRFHEEAVS